MMLLEELINAIIKGLPEGATIRPLEELIRAMICQPARKEITEDEWLFLANLLDSISRKKGRPAGLKKERADFERDVFEQVVKLCNEQKVSKNAAMEELAWPNPDTSFEFDYEAIKKIVSRVKKRDKEWGISIESERKRLRNSLENRLEEIFEEQQGNSSAVCPYCGSGLKEGTENT
ncbi:hypothetical protein MJO47_10025 [Desulfuromonas sp. KJ2020]|uniref:hypothetical protein n=1 Tax=Desulfuromonas sp. KJ2020 TaxID=2919173 RepID=UPI0020A74EBB|nr:hypothetical protein [Desulfuromonas sp. KJ2020]MCP3177436.1 hypothetical protein [Desulfuromonas sp. KJ2020]